MSLPVHFHLSPDNAYVAYAVAAIPAHRPEHDLAPEVAPFEVRHGPTLLARAFHRGAPKTLQQSPPRRADQRDLPHAGGSYRRQIDLVWSARGQLQRPANRTTVVVRDRAGRLFLGRCRYQRHSDYSAQCGRTLDPGLAGAKSEFQRAEHRLSHLSATFPFLRRALDQHRRFGQSPTSPHSPPTAARSSSRMGGPIRKFPRRIR